MKEVWPAILVTGVSFAVPQFVISNYINPWIVDIGASLVSMAALILFLKVWQPKTLWLSPKLRTRDESADTIGDIIRGYRDLLAGRTTGREVWGRLKAANRVGVTRGTLEERRNPLAIL
jgi:hypothetical protein